MDPATAKTLVSLLLVLAIVTFGLLSFEMFLSEVLRDFKVGRVRRAAREGARTELGPAAPNR